MDFDRNAIGSLEDVHREWDSLETERAKVENKLRSFDASRGGRGAGPWGRGGRGGGGGGGGRGHGFTRGGGGDWSRDGPRDNKDANGGREAPLQKSYQVSREKQRAMSGTWERGLDPATAALEEDAPPKQSEGRGRFDGSGGPRGDGSNSMATYQRAADSGRDVGARRVNGGGMRGDRGGGMRGDRGNVRGDRDALHGGMRGGANGTRAGPRGDFDRFGNGGGSGRGGAREHDYRGGRGGGGRGAGEPDAKRPRVTSMIVVAREEDNGDETAENGELDRWNSEPAPASTVSAAAEAASPAATKDHNDDDDDDDDDNVDYEPEPEPEAGDRTAATADSDKEKAAEGAQAMDEEEAEEGRGDTRRPAGKIVVVSGGGPRGRAARVGGVAGSGGIRGSLTSRLGPPMGRPVMVKDEEGGGGEGGFVPFSERPMPEPSKPELHVAYKDGDTKKRNRRMFGGLMAHLGRARKQLDHDQTLIERQKSVAEMAAIRQAQEKRQHRLAAVSAAREERDEELHKRDYINARQQKTLVALHGNAFIANQDQLKWFIFTKTLPKLAWTPNEHTDVTQALLSDSNAEIDGRIEGRKEADDREFQKIDDMVAQRAAARASGRSGNANAAGERRPYAGQRDRGANPYGEGKEDRWPTAGGGAAAGEQGDHDKGEGPGLSGARRKRADGDADARSGDGGSGASPLVHQDNNGHDDHVVGDADQPVPEEREAAEVTAGVPEGDGMEVDGGDESRMERGQRQSSPPQGGSPTPAVAGAPSTHRDRSLSVEEDGWSGGEGGRGGVDGGDGNGGGGTEEDENGGGPEANGARAAPAAPAAARSEERREREDSRAEDAPEEDGKKDKKKKKKARGDRESSGKSDAPREKKASRRRRSK